MFTLEQIKAAHSKVKSGADFPDYVKELKVLGVLSYATYVSDGHTLFSGADGYSVLSPAKYDSKPLACNSNKTVFVSELKAHQQGKTDYPTFCAMCAETGVEKWITDISEMTCTYYSKSGEELLVEKIPE